MKQKPKIIAIKIALEQYFFCKSSVVSIGLIFLLKLMNL